MESVGEKSPLSPEEFIILIIGDETNQEKKKKTLVWAVLKNSTQK